MKGVKIFWSPSTSWHGHINIDSYGIYLKHTEPNSCFVAAYYRNNLQTISPNCFIPNNEQKNFKIVPYQILYDHCYAQTWVGTWTNVIEK